MWVVGAIGVFVLIKLLASRSQVSPSTYSPTYTIAPQTAQPWNGGTITTAPSNSGVTTPVATDTSATVTNYKLISPALVGRYIS